MPESADSRPRLGDLLLGAGLLTQAQLDESLAVAQAAGKPLGQILVEQGLVSPHSIAMALADQHGGPLKTEFGFAMGRGSTSRTPALPAEQSSAPPVLRLAPAESGASEPVSSPAAPVLREVAVQPVADVVQLEAETTARLSAEAKAAELLARVAELQAELEAAGPRAAVDAALRSQLAAERAAREQDAQTVQAWRALLEEARAANEQAAEAAQGLRAQLEELRARDGATAATEEQLASARDELAAALAAGEELRLQLAAERATNERAAASADALSAQIEELRGQRAADSATEDSLAAARAELAAAVADADGLRDTIADERAKSERTASTAETLRAELDELRTNSGAVDALRARVVELEAAALEAAAREAQPPLVVPPHVDVDELRAVIELQEQALAAAVARERAWDGDARVVVDASSTRSYSNDLHFLFAPSTDGYELLERSGPSPSSGEVVELSGGRTCRVTRVGPAPFPGAPEACAYLELA